MERIYTRDLVVLVMVLNSFENRKEQNEKVKDPSFGELIHDIPVIRLQVHA